MLPVRPDNIRDYTQSGCYISLSVPRSLPEEMQFGPEQHGADLRPPCGAAGIREASVSQPALCKTWILLTQQLWV